MGAAEPHQDNSGSACERRLRPEAQHAFRRKASHPAARAVNTRRQGMIVSAPLPFGLGRQAMRLHRGFRRLALAITAALVVAAAAAPSGAVETPAGSKNFTAPGYVPNYFSNESVPFQGGAGARAGQPGAVPVFAAPAPRHRGSYAYSSRRHHGRHWARGSPRGRYRHIVRGRGAAHRQFAAAGRRGRAAATGRPPVRTVAHHGAAHAGGRRIARAGR